MPALVVTGWPFHSSTVSLCLALSARLLSNMAGKPVLLIEQQGKKLSALPSASREDVAAAVARLPSLCDGNRNARHKLTVEEWNGRPVTATEGRELLEAAGFVRDYQGMTLYAVWR